MREREWGRTFVSFVYKLHQSLFLDSAGETLLGLIGIGLLTSIVTGVWLWWPRRGMVMQVV